jgi:hypothetical protein
LYVFFGTIARYKDFTHMGNIKQSRTGPNAMMLLYNTGILNRQRPSAKIDDFAP